MEILPCVVFAFNRPAKLRRILNALRDQEIDRLVVFIDGPRDSKDLPTVERCRKLVREIDWVETEPIFWDDNRGLGRLSDNVGLVLENHPAAVFLEDDCLPAPGFFPFMRQALDRYKGEAAVFSIGGYQPIPPSFFAGYPYSLVSCARFTCWGWATWRDRWARVQPYLSRYAELFGDLRRVSEIAGADLPAIARDMAAGKSSESWDVKVAIVTLWLRMVHLLAVRGLVRNIGQDRSGVHGGLASALRGRVFQNRNVSTEMPTDYHWLEDVSLDCDYAGELRSHIYRVQSYSVSRLRRRGGVLLRRYIWPRREQLNELNLLQESGDKLNKRALLSYITHPFSIPRDDPRFLRHINIWRAHAMVRALNRMDYMVDVIDYRDLRFRPEKHYDLLIGHGGVNFEQIAEMLPASTVKIYFSTGSNWKCHNDRELARFEALRKRRGVDLPLDRYIRSSEEAALQCADGIIGIGNRVTGDTYAGFSPVVMIDGASLYDDTFDWCEKDYQAGRSHFLFYAGAGNVHKGLDLLLDAFSDLELHLWICTIIDRHFARVYARELNECSNIHALGWVQQRSSQFYEVMRTCNFAILPTCSEGQSQSIVESMNQGLVPVVSRYAGLNVDDFGIWIEDTSIEYLRELVQSVAALAPERSKEMSLAARQSAQTRFSEERFSLNLQAAIQVILDKQGGSDVSLGG